MIFKNTYGEQFNIEEVGTKLKKFYTDDPSNEYKLYVGTDSQKLRKHVLFVSVIVFHRVGKNCIMFYLQRKEEKDKYKNNVVGRILQEVADSANMIQVVEKTKILDIIGSESLEVHIDAGANGKSRSVMESAIGYIKGLGYTPKVKPNAMAASAIADKFTK